MKILVINKFLYPKGGDAICTLATAELLRSRGHEVILWGMKHPANPPCPHQEFFVDNLDLNNAGGIKTQLAIAAKIIYSFEAKRKIEALIRKIGKPDIVHLNNFAHQISPSIVDVFKKYHIPTVMTMHDFKLVCGSYSLLSKGLPCERCAGGRHYNCFLEGCVKGSKAKSFLSTIEMYLHHKVLHIYDYIHTFISPSDFMRNKLKGMGFSRQTVLIPNFIDATRYVPKYDVTERRAVFFGRLSREKGLVTLINAVKGLDMRLDLIGDGPLKETLMNKVRDEKIDNVFFLGYMTGDVLKERVSSAMFVVLSSEWYENNPLSVLEAFAMGKPVAGARTGGIPELVVDGQTGLTFEAGNATDQRETISRMLALGPEVGEMGRRARALVEEKFNKEVYLNALMDVYRKAIKG